MTLMTSRCAWSILLFCCCRSPLPAAVIYVNQFATGNNTGLSWADAYTDLQLALAAAQSGDEVWVAAGTYYPTAGADRYASFVLPAGVSLYGGFTGSESSLEARDWLANSSVLDGDIGNPADSSDNSHSVVTVFDPQSGTLIDGFTIQNGAANSKAAEVSTYDAARRGGGVLIRTDSAADDYLMTIRNCLFSGHVAEYGGAIYGDARYNKRLSILVDNCTFEDNHALFGAAYSTDAGNTGPEGVQFINCSFRRNRTEVYGVIYIQAEGEEDGHLLIDGCLFEDNENEIIDVYNYFSEVYFRLQINRTIIRNNKNISNNLPLIGYRPNDLSSLEMDSVIFVSNVGQSSLVNPGEMGDFTVKNSYFEKNEFVNLFHIRPRNFFLDSTRFLRNELVSAMLIIGGGVVEINSLECSENRSPSLLRIYSHLSPVKTQMQNCRFESNLAAGLLDIGGDSLLVSGLKILEDQGTNGNVRLNASYNRVVNSTFLRRDSSFSSIPLVMPSHYEMALEFENCTFYNYGVTDSGLLFRFPQTNANTHSLQINNSIIWDTLSAEHPLFSLENAKADIVLNHSLIPNTVCDSSLIQEIYYNRDTVIGNISCDDGMLLGANPLFKNAAGGDLTLLACSPALDAGENALWPGLPEWDLAGSPRILNDRIDLGAYESAPDASVFDLTQEIIPASAEMAADGSIELLSVSGGTPEYHYEWSNGETLSRIRQLLPGIYTLTITDQLGCSQEFSFTVDFTSAVVDPAEAWKTRLSPNPARRGQPVQLQLSENSEIRTLRLITPQGQVLWKRGWPGGQTQLPLSVPEAKGMYLVELTDAQGRRGYLKWMVQ